MKDPLIIHFKKCFVLALISYFFSYPLTAQQNTEWSAITSFNTINSISQDSDGVIWGVSNGGLFSFEEGSFTNRLTSVDGMYRLDGRVIYYLEDYNLFIIGYIDGMLDLYYPETGTFDRVEDIQRVQSFSSRAINAILYQNQRLYIATEFGVVVYDPSSFLVTQSFTRIGSFDRGTPVYDLDIENGSIYLATQQGVAYANIEDNLNLESSWTNVTNDDGLPSGSVQSVAFYNDVIYASTSTENVIFQDGVWQNNESYENHQNIKYRKNFDIDILAAYSPNHFFLTNPEGNTETFNVQSSAISDLYHDATLNSKIYIASATLGMGEASLSDMNLQFISPEGPNLNFFEGMSFDQSVFISGTTRLSQRSTLLDNPKGYYIYDGEEWKNFNRLNNEVLAQNLFRQTFTTTFTEEYYYIGSWGRGIARHNRETDEITVFNANNSTLRGWAADSETFPVISGLETDSEEAVWVTSRFATNPLYVQLPGEDEWIMYSKSSALSGTDEYVGLFVDSIDQKWITLQSVGRAGRGLLVLDTGDSENINDMTGVKLTDDLNNGNLPNMSVSDIIEDRNGEVWIGTERGIARFIFPQFVITGSPEERRSQWLLNENPDAESPFLLRDINVTSLAVNSANQKWVGTAGEGVWLLNESGSAILKHFTADNSPLLSNVIRDIAIQELTGEVFISTELGLSVYQDTPLSPVESMDELKVYPNPFLYERHESILIENLSEITTIRILGVDGTLIQTLDNRGGRAEWNALDFRGRQVGSGVYIVVALGPDGSERGVGKVAIIR